jgi:hypothetical protein
MQRSLFHITTDTGGVLVPQIIFIVLFRYLFIDLFTSQEALYWLYIGIYWLLFALAFEFIGVLVFEKGGLSHSLRAGKSGREISGSWACQSPVRTVLDLHGSIDKLRGLSPDGIALASPWKS